MGLKRLYHLFFLLVVALFLKGNTPDVVAIADARANLMTRHIRLIKTAKPFVDVTKPQLKVRYRQSEVHFDLNIATVNHRCYSDHFIAYTTVYTPIFLKGFSSSATQRGPPAFS